MSAYSHSAPWTIIGLTLALSVHWVSSLTKDPSWTGRIRHQKGSELFDCESTACNNANYLFTKSMGFECHAQTNDTRKPDECAIGNWSDAVVVQWPEKDNITCAPYMTGAKYIDVKFPRPAKEPFSIQLTKLSVKSLQTASGWQRLCSKSVLLSYQVPANLVLP